MPLSDREREILESASVGETAFNGLSDHPDDHDPDGDGPLAYPWRDGRATVTLEMCNAIRCAAHDGVSYTRIAEMFDALCGRGHARQHAVGSRPRCTHDGVEPVTEGRTPGPEGKLSAADCATMRRRYESGEYDTYTAAGEAFGLSRPSAARHIKGNCGH